MSARTHVANGCRDAGRNPCAGMTLSAALLRPAPPLPAARHFRRRCG
jgi:hypothetical protein